MTKKTLSWLLADTEARTHPASDPAVSGIALRSDRVTEGSVFFCVPGFRHDGHDFAAEAARNGAVALVVSRPLDLPVPQAIVPDVRVALARSAARYWGYPTRSLNVLGITGTNGKTTTTYLAESILQASGRSAGLIGTIETRFGDRRYGSTHTTPDAAELQRLFSEMVQAGVDAVAMEVSSHALDLHRVDGVEFAVAAFTNLSQDHLDYHHTFEEYWSVKRRLFTEFEVRERVVNIDDPYGARLAADLGVRWTVGRDPAAAIRVADERPGPVSTAFTLITPAWSAALTLPLTGRYNVSNALVAAGCAVALGVEGGDVVAGLERAPQVPGRLERIDEGQPFTVFVDYAHTPDGLEQAIAAVRAVTPGRVILVFGCGGDRDPEKRPLMGAVAGRGADEIIVTSDNPRTEDPVGIILQIEDGVRQTGAAHQVEVDRRSAIAVALSLAVEGDAVLIAGKGHEDYQIFADRTIHFDDREVAREGLRVLC